MKSKLFIGSVLVCGVFIFVITIAFQSVSASASSKDGSYPPYSVTSTDHLKQLTPAADIIVGGAIISNTTWTAGNVYVVQTDVTVGTGLVLTIEPGTIVKFQDGHSLIVHGLLQAQGTIGQRIYFTSWYDDSVGGDTNGDSGSNAPSPGNWKSIRFDDASDDTSLIEFAVIRYGGGWGATGGVEIHDASPSLRNNQISQNYTNGIYLDTAVPSLPSRPQILTNTLWLNSSYAVSSDVDSQPQLSGNILTSNGGNGLEIRGGAIQSNVIWDQTQMVYILSSNVSIAPGAQLTVMPGLIVKFRDNCGLLVDGNLHAAGTVGQKIYFTSWYDDSVGGDTNGDGSSTPLPGTWKSIRFDDSSDDTSLIDYAVIRYGGGWGAAGGVEIYDASPSLRNSQISQHYTNGVSVASVISQAQPTLGCLDIENNKSYGLFNSTPTTVVNAQQLWWGSPSGPYHPVLNPSGTGNRVGDGVIFTPWRTSKCGSPPLLFVYLPLIKR